MYLSVQFFTWGYRQVSALPIPIRGEWYNCGSHVTRKQLKNPTLVSNVEIGSTPLSPSSLHMQAPPATHERRQTKRVVSKVDIPDGTEYTDYTECQAFFPVVRIRSAHPLTRKRMLILPLLGPIGEVGGSSQSGPWTNSNIFLLRCEYYVIFTSTAVPIKYQSITVTQPELDT